MAQKIYDVLYIGNYTKDTIITPTGTRYVDGGAVNYAAHAAAHLGVSVAVVTRLAKEDDRLIESFKKDGIDCFETYTPQSTLMKLEYPTTDPDIRTLTVAGYAGNITAKDVDSLSAKAAVIGPSLRGEVGLDVIKVLQAKKMIIAADMQGYVRVLRGTELNYEPWPEMAETLSHVNIVKSDMVEAEFLTGETDVLKAAKFYANMGPQEIVLTHRDGVLIYANGTSYEMGFFPSQLIGRSGRGDTCIGTYVAMRLSKSPREAGIWAAAVTSLKMEKLGPFDRSIAEVEAFIHDKYNHGSIH
ncbi:MAG: PfkB family carbohydrate kinase [Anaerolineaceae bacterium]